MRQPSSAFLSITLCAYLRAYSQAHLRTYLRTYSHAFLSLTLLLSAIAYQNLVNTEQGAIIGAVFFA